MKITAGLIIRNEADRYLGMAFANLSEFVDQVCIYDDGSTDEWRDLLPEGLATTIYAVQSEERDSQPAFHRHAIGRNKLLDMTLMTGADWIVASDADELFSDPAAIRRVCESTSADLVTAIMAEVWEICPENLCVREDGDWRSHPIGVAWRVAPFRYSRLSLRDRQTATGRVPDAIHRASPEFSGEALYHFGWANEAERAERFKRYPPGSGHANRHVASIMWPSSRVKLEGWAWTPGVRRFRKELLAKVVA